MMSELRHIYYRGALRSCNYQCSYCPFAKRKTTQRELDEDAQALHRFVDWICTRHEQTPLTIMLVPYGEALIHPYYWQALAQLTRCTHVLAVGCQTNLSFSIEDMLRHFTDYGGCKEKLRLWCTFHGSMTTQEAFVTQCHTLKHHNIACCAGAVGDPAQIEAITQLRSRLSATIYLWINRMDGLKRAYTPVEQQSFTTIDPYFPLELAEPPAAMQQCTGGRQSLFIRGDGSCYSCNINHRRLGNIYTDDWEGKWSLKGCSAKRCHCYLSYCNRIDQPSLVFFDLHPSFRQPILDHWQPLDKRQVQAIFFDLDGSLTDQAEGNGSLRPQLQAALPLLAEQYPLYLATQRPERGALQLCGEYSQYFSGGVFADGSYIKTTQQTSPVIVPLTLDEDTQSSLAAIAHKWQLELRRYRHRGQLYKITLCSRTITPIPQAAVQLIQKTVPTCHMETTARTIGLVASTAGKWQGILQLLSSLDMDPSCIAYLGDAPSDADIFHKILCAIALSDSHPAAQAAARYRLRVK